MRNATRLGAAAVLAAVMTFAFGGTAQAYPDPTITITLPDDELIGGQTFDYTADSGGTPCDWTVTYSEAVNGPANQTASGTTSISGTYDTKVVSTRTPTPLTASCEYDPDDVPVGAPTTYSAEVQVQAADTASASATVYLLPLSDGAGDGDADGGGDDNGGLPGTGGASLWIVIAGAALVLLGGGAVALSRRNSH